MRRVPARIVVLLLAQEAAEREDHRYLVSGDALRRWVQRGHVHRHRNGYDLDEVYEYVTTKRRIECYPRRAAA